MKIYPVASNCVLIEDSKGKVLRIYDFEDSIAIYPMTDKDRFKTENVRNHIDIMFV